MNQKGVLGCGRMVAHRGLIHAGGSLLPALRETVNALGQIDVQANILRRLGSLKNFIDAIPSTSVLQIN